MLSYAPNNLRVIGLIVGLLCGLLGTRVLAVFDRDFDPGSYEEDGGSGFTVFTAVADEVYGVGFGSGLWLINTPVFGDYRIRTFYHGVEHAYYSGLGMTLRIKPRWTLAPFVGIGGDYNYSVSRRERPVTSSGRQPGESYWSGHGEAGIRVWMSRRLEYIEVSVRQARNWGPADEVTIALSFGRGVLPARRPVR